MAMGIMARGSLGAFVFMVVTLASGVAFAEPTAAPNPNRAAGWAVIGVGSSLGLGSATTGIFMLMNPASLQSEQRVGGATLAGGIITVVVALVVGVPLVASANSPGAASSASSNPRATSTTLAQALNGEFRF